MATVSRKVLNDMVEVADEIAAKHGGKVPKMTVARQAVCEANVISKIASKKPLTAGTKDERILQIERSLRLGAASKNPSVVALMKALAAELEVVKKLKK
jgi:hypothetical protein